MKNEKRRVENGGAGSGGGFAVRAAACGEVARADLRDASRGPSRGKAAARRCRRLRVCLKRARSRAEGPAFERRGDAALRPGAAAGCRSLRDRVCRKHIDDPGCCSPLRLYSEPQMQDSELDRSAGGAWAYVPIRAAACGEAARADLRDASCGPPPGGGCGPPVTARSNPTTSPPAGKGCSQPIPAGSNFQKQFGNNGPLQQPAGRLFHPCRRNGGEKRSKAC